MPDTYNNSHVVEVLLVEDNPGDARLTQEALREGKLRNRIHHARDGVEALAFLRREGEFHDAPQPDIILLDLNMPRKDGREALKEMKADPVLRRIPIVVLTTSKAEEDILRSYDLGVNSYVTKPVTFKSLVELIKVLGQYWFEVVELPND